LIATERKADSLASSLEFQLHTVDLLQAAIFDDRMSDEKLNAAKDQRIAQLEKMNERLHKGKTFWKKAAQVGAVIIVTETLLILAQ